MDTGNADGCHTFIMGRGHPLRARGVTMDDLVRYIENWTDLPVVNRTGLRGLFAIDTEGWTTTSNVRQATVLIAVLLYYGLGSRG